MKRFLFPQWLWALPAVMLVSTSTPAQTFLVQIGTAPPPPTTLVDHGEIWRYHKGTTAPVADWKTAAEASLDGTWLSGPGGFGFGDGDDATVLNDMLNGYTTVYIRKTIEITEAVDPERRLRLVMDWDDGFIAWLDGVEIARSSNTPGAVGTEPPNTATTTAGQNHEASAGGGAAPTAYDLGPVGNRLQAGTHVLAVMGLNAAANSSDFSLIADLSVVGGQGAAASGELFSVVTASPIQIIATNSWAGVARVAVNGNELAFDSVSQLWTGSQNLKAGLNRLFVAALDNSGAIVASTNRDVVFVSSTTEVGGELSGTTIWDGGGNAFYVSSPVVVPDGAELLINNGAVVLLGPGGSITATTNGSVTVAGTSSEPIVFGPADGTSPWRDLAAAGTNAALTIRHSEVVAGQVRALRGGSVLVEDSVLRDLADTSREFIQAVNGADLTVRRTYAARFGEMDSQNTPVLFEDCLLEQFAIDGLDIKSTNNVPLIVRRTTLRRADPNNSNADGIDFGPGAGLVEFCLIQGFPDKGVSIGGAPGTQVNDSLIYNCGIGLSAYSSLDLRFSRNTISSCAQGILFRNNPQPAIGAATNLIVWGNQNNVVVSNTSVLELGFSDVQGTNWPGDGNISADPLFANAAAADFTLLPGSPALGSGLGGANMGTSFPVGGLPGAPLNLAARVTGTNVIRLEWQDDSENETGFELERSLDGDTWTLLASAANGGLTQNVAEFTDLTAAIDQRYYYRARAVNGSGTSRYSNIAGAIRAEPILTVGGVLAANTTWSPANGMVLVADSVTVPANVTLTIQAGTQIKVTNTAGIRAVDGGTINIVGTAENPVTIMPLTPGTLWRELSAQFAGATLQMQHVDMSGGQITIYSNAVGVIEDSFIHDYRLLSGGTLFTSPIILTHFAAPTVVRRCHVREYHETLWRNGVLTIEDCLFENIHGDAVDFDSAQDGTVLRSTTFRHGTSGNVDAVDVGPGNIAGSFNVRIENCLMFDFPFDKGVSIGDSGSSSGTIVSNCLIYSCLSGVQAKDRCDVSVRNCTIVENNWGLTNYNKVNPASTTGGGITTNAYNNIIWDNGITISMANGGALYADHNILGNTNWPGTGNIDVDPLFLNAAQRDYRLSAGSPARGAGRDGADLGAKFPVGSPMAPSHPQITSISVDAGSATVKFWADNEKSYSLQCADNPDGGVWVNVASIATSSRPRFLSVTNTLAPDKRFYRLVTPQVP